MKNYLKGSTLDKIEEEQQPIKHFLNSKKVYGKPLAPEIIDPKNRLDTCDSRYSSVLQQRRDLYV